MMRTIYLVDDDDAVRASLHSLLALGPNHVVRSFRSGDAFLAELPALPAGALLLDIRMPGSSGLDVLREIRAFDRKFAAVILTGEANIELAIQAMKMGALDFIEKPYDPEKLLATVASAFSRLDQDSTAASEAADARRKITLLSPRERDVLMGLIEGRPNKVIAHQLDISPRTVEIYRAHLMKKLQVRSLSDALRIAFAAGLIPAA